MARTAFTPCSFWTLRARTTVGCFGQTEIAKMKVATPLMRLQDPEHTRVVIVTLAETTPIQEAAKLQDDLRRAEIEPSAWVVNKSLAATKTTDPLLSARAREEMEQLATVESEYARRLFVVPWTGEEPSGVVGLRALAASSA